jgi:hypothetical protein
MAFVDCTKEYVDLLTYNKYVSRTASTTEFETIKSMQSVYLNPSTCAVPDAKYTKGLALLVAHYYALDDVQSPEAGGPDTTVGAITTERVGKLTQTRGMQPYLGAVDGSKTYLMQTKYGAEFVFLMKSFKSSPSTT